MVAYVNSLVLLEVKSFVKGWDRVAAAGGEDEDLVGCCCCSLLIMGPWATNRWSWDMVPGVLTYEESSVPATHVVVELQVEVLMSLAPRSVLGREVVGWHSLGVRLDSGGM
jgi:hypothetical protein